MSILDRRCFHHDAREAVAQCPTCKLFYCRECVTEHAGRMICVTCVNALTRDAGKSARASRARWTLTALAGLLIAWLVFYYLGLALARIPSKFHGVSETAKTWGLTTLSQGDASSPENDPPFVAAWTERSVPMPSPRSHIPAALVHAFRGAILT